MSRWKNLGLLKTAINLNYLDFLYLISYSYLLFSVCYWIGEKSENPASVTAEKFCVLSLFPGFFDLMENILIAGALFKRFDDFSVFLLFCFSMTKWVFALIVVVYILFKLFTIAIRRANPKPTFS